MKRLPLLFLAIITTTTLLLTACQGAQKTSVDVKKASDTLFETFLLQEAVDVSGVLSDGDTRTEISGTVDAKNKAIRLSIGEAVYFYYAKTLFCDSGNGYEVFDVNTSYAAVLKRLPFSAFFFTYDKDDCEKAYVTDGHLIVTFGGAGVKRCFASDKNVSGGVFTVSNKEGKISSTYLTTKLTDGQGERTYSAYYTYAPGESLDLSVDVRPTDGAAYASYAAEKLVASNGQKTLRLSDNGKNTGVTLDAILPLSQSEYVAMNDVDNAFAVDSEVYATLNIVYKSAKTVIGLGSSVREIAVTYQKSDYAVTLVTVNAGLRYVLE